jgi:hypothetical protein
MGIAAFKNNFDISGTRAGITKIMASNPRRVSAIEVVMDFPSVIYSDREKKIIENAALTCPVALSIHPDIEQKVSFNYFSG